MTATPQTYDKLSDLMGDDLSSALAARMANETVPNKRGSLTLVHLLNAHFGADRLLCSELPPDASIPHRYEGDFGETGYGRGYRRSEPVWRDGGILERFGDCRAIYA